MSPRSPALTLAAVACLVLLTLASPLLARPARAYGEHVFQENPVVGAGDPYYGVYGGVTLAQSFRVTESYVLTNLTLRVRNDGGGMNALVVSIHPDDPVRHVPVMGTRLASASWVTPNGGSPPVNWSFPLNPSPTLQGGGVYWIVAENNASAAPPTDGYEWHESNGDTYPNGSAYVLNRTSGVWTGLPYDLYFVTYGRAWASEVSLGMTASRATMMPGDSVTFTVAFNNSGDQTARWVWINATLPAYLANTSLAFPGSQPVSAAAFPNLVFANVTNGAHDFTISGQAAIGTPPGTVLTTSASLDYVNSTGATSRGQLASASVLVGLVTKQLYLANASTSTQVLTTTAPASPASAFATLARGATQPLDFVLAPALARTFAFLKASVSLWVSTNATAPQDYRLNVTLLDNGTTVASTQAAWTQAGAGYALETFSLGTANHSFARGHTIGLSLQNAGGPNGSTDALLLRYNGTAFPSRMDVVTPTYVSVDTLTLADPVTGGSLWSPLDPLVVSANVSDPFGAARIRSVWANITSPLGTEVASTAMTVNASDASPLPAWKLYGTTLLPPLVTGTYRVDIAAMEDNGAVDLARAYAEVVDPVFSLVDVTSLGGAQAGASYAYYLHYNNTGTGIARNLWINETLPVEVTYTGSSFPYTSSTANHYTWSLTNVTVGPHELEIDVAVPGSSTVPAWIRDNATLEFTDGSGHAQAMLSASAPVFLNGPVFAVAVAAAPSAGIHANETVVYSVSLRNTGATSGVTWVNDTIPLGFTYVTDNAATLGGSFTLNGSRLLYVFAVVPAGASWTLQITLAAGAHLARNGSYVDRVAVNYTSVNAYAMPEAIASASLLALSPWFTETNLTFLASNASPGGSVAASVRLLNQGNEIAPRVWLNLTLDTRLTVTDASEPFTSGPGFADLVLQNASLGWTQVWLNLSVNPGANDGATLWIGGTLDAADGFGNPLPRYDLPAASTLVSTENVSVSVAPTTLDIEAGASVSLTVTLDNLGTVAATDIWLNVTIPGTLAYVNDTSGQSPAVISYVYLYHWTAPSPALEAHARTAFTLTVAARAATPNGTAADLMFQLDSKDAHHISRPTVYVTGHAVVLAPTLVLHLLASGVNLPGGASLNYTLQVTNTGMTAAAAVSVIEDVDPQLVVVTYASQVPATGSQDLTWNFTDLGPGQSVTMDLTVRIAEGVPAGTDIVNSIVVVYTNSAGTVLGSIRSLPVTVHVTADLSSVYWIFGVAAVLGVLLVALLVRRGHAEIEEVFLVYRDGVLISHLSRTLLREKDEDVLSGMLTAVQEFVRETFQYGEDRDLHQLDFGDYRILIERGRYVYLAVVYAGEESTAVRKKVRSVIDLIESQFGSVLEKWDGDMEDVVGARDLIREALLGTNGHNHTDRSIPQYE